MNKNVVIIVTKGYILKTGYYFRVNREYNLMKSMGCSVSICLIIGNTRCGIPKDINIDFICSPFNIFKLKNILNNFNVIYCQNIGSSFVVTILKILKSLKKNINLIMVYHGSLAELKLMKFGLIKKIVYSFVEKYVLVKFNHVVLVSNSFKKYLCDKYKTINAKLVVIPNFPNNDFIETILKIKNKPISREVLELPLDKKIITYVGNVQKWQNLEYILTLMNEIRRLDDKYFFIFLSNEIEAMKNKIKKYTEFENDDFLLKNIPNSEVPKYLLTSDFLVVIRSEDDINKVACPTKAVEYLFSGKELIISDNLGDISEIVRNYNLGYIINYKISIADNAKNIINHIPKTKERQTQEYLKIFSPDYCFKLLKEILYET